jgi:signal transduction histidine kinase
MSKSGSPPSWVNSFKKWWEAQAAAFGAVQQPGQRRRLEITAWFIMMVIGVADYFSGYEISLRFAYIVPITLMVAARGRRRAAFLAVVCDFVWQSCDIAAGAHFSSVLVPIWNMSITLINYFLLIWLLGALLDFQRRLEEKVQQRTLALSEEIAERERLEREVTTIAEKERWEMGNELHDGICQEFTAAALAAQHHVRRLEKDNPAAVTEAKGVVRMIEDGIGQTRRLAKGLLLVTIEEDGLSLALAEMARTCGRQFHVACDFEQEGEPVMADLIVNTHLFRIAQEAARNAARHGQARAIKVKVVFDAGTIRVSVRDDGEGLNNAEAITRGLGLRIMDHRARVIGAQFKVESQPGGGTLVECLWPAPPAIA